MLMYFIPQILWRRKYRQSVRCTALMAFVTWLPALFERIVIYMTTLYKDYLPSSWVYYGPDLAEIAVTLGSYCLLLALTYAIVCRKQEVMKHR